MKLKHDPLSNEQSVTWLTADIVELLRQVRMEKGRVCQTALKWLKKMQNQHGGWHTFWTRESSPAYTVLAVEVLVLSGMLAREDLLADVEVYGR